MKTQSYFAARCFKRFEGVTGTSLTGTSWLVFRQIWLVPAKRKKIHVLFSIYDDNIKSLLETKIILKRKGKKLQTWIFTSNIHKRKYLTSNQDHLGNCARRSEKITLRTIIEVSNNAVLIFISLFKIIWPIREGKQNNKRTERFSSLIVLQGSQFCTWVFTMR